MGQKLHYIDWIQAILVNASSEIEECRMDTIPLVKFINSDAFTSREVARVAKLLNRRQSDVIADIVSVMRICSAGPNVENVMKDAKKQPKQE